MATIKSFSDLNQSKVLSQILPPESADWTILNCFNEFGQKDGSNIRVVKEVNTLNESVEKIPCWSLAALLSVIPKHIDEFNVLRIDISTNDFSIWYDEIGYGVNNDLPNITMESAVNTCYEMILKLNELKML